MPINKRKYKRIRTIVTPVKGEHILIGVKKGKKGRRGGTTELIEIREHNPESKLYGRKSKYVHNPLSKE
jgi:hypothetical protein